MLKSRPSKVFYVYFQNNVAHKSRKYEHILLKSAHLLMSNTITSSSTPAKGLRFVFETVNVAE